MKKILYILLFSFPIVSWGQNESFTIENRLNSVTITPNAIKAKRTAFDSLLNNVILGKGNLLNSLTHENNIAIGVNVLQKNGQGATLSHFASFGNIGVGVDVLKENTLGYQNTAIGNNALIYNTEGYNNIALGPYALLGNKTGVGNIGIGIRALQTVESNYSNIAIGNSALQQLNSGNSNLAIGQAALYGIGVSVARNFSDNVAIGTSAQQGAWTGNNNVSLGNESMRYVTKGNFNVAIGNKAFRGGSYEFDWNGSRNVCMGYEALASNLYGNGNVAIGYRAGFSETTSNNLYIDNSDTLAPLIGGKFLSNRVGINRLLSDINTTNYTFQVGGDASKDVAGNWASHSDRRLKKNIQVLNSQEILQKLLQLQGVTYEWNDKVTSTKRPEGIQYGFIAQNIEEVFPSKIKKDANGYLMTAYGDYDPMVVEAIRALNQRIEMLEKQNQELRASLEGIIKHKNEDTNAQSAKTK